MDFHESSRSFGGEDPLDGPDRAHGQSPPADGPDEDKPADASEAAAEGSARERAGSGAPDEIMSRLPHSRPSPPKIRRTQRPRARSRRPVSEPPKPPTPPRTPPRAPALSLPEPEPAPGLPRLAVDGVVEAAKLPLKVGATITSRALSALAHGLRRE